jgi:hypothetical protein
MKHGHRRVFLTILGAASASLLASTAVSRPLGAQTLQFDRRSGGYGGVGFGGGNFTLTCDSGCTGNRLSAPGARLFLGRHFGTRIRAELGFQYQSNSEASSNAFGASLGAAVYVAGGLHVRGGVAYQTASVEESTGTYTARGGPGFTVGAGYDLYVGRTSALTPYVSYTTGSISRITRTMLGGATSRTSGSMNVLHFGLAYSRTKGQFTCITAAGESIPLSGRNRARFLGCLNDVERRLGRTSSFKR